MGIFKFPFISFREMCLSLFLAAPSSENLSCTSIHWVGRQESIGLMPELCKPRHEQVWWTCFKSGRSVIPGRRIQVSLLPVLVLSTPPSFAELQPSACNGRGRDNPEERKLQEPQWRKLLNLMSEHQGGGLIQCVKPQEIAKAKSFMKIYLEKPQCWGVTVT